MTTTLVTPETVAHGGRLLAATGVLSTWLVGGELNVGGFHMGARWHELGERVCGAFGSAATPDTRMCTGCGQPIMHVGTWRVDVWVVVGSGSTGQGMSMCPPDPDHDGEFSEHNPRELVGAEWLK